MVEESHSATLMELESNLEYVKNYYPSGTKQVSGSTVDKLVENCRNFSIEELVRLRKIKQKLNDEQNKGAKDHAGAKNSSEGSGNENGGNASL